MAAGACSATASATSLLPAAVARIRHSVARHLLTRNAELQARGVRVSRKRVARLMPRENGGRGRVRRNMIVARDRAGGQT